jgi:undecaprenyl-diphosphatase
MGDFCNITLLALLQGVAEFLPVSSSGHLVIAQHLLGVNASGKLLDLSLHVGTLVSIAVFYRSTIWRIVAGREWRMMLKLAVSAVPAVIVYFLFKNKIDSLFENAKMVGALLMFTGAVVGGTRILPQGKGEVTFLRAAWMGLMQAVALLPGVSRSGMTIAAARSGGVDPGKSAEFSFLMSAPLIAGGMALELLSFTVDAPAAGGWPLILWGMAVAAVSGYLSLMLLVKTLKSRWFWVFGPYCLGVGLVVLWLL